MRNTDIIYKDLEEFSFHGLIVPEHMHPQIANYINNGSPVDSFLSAVICNDLKSAAAYAADSVNVRLIAAYIMFFYNYAPSKSWGSAENYRRWIDRGGLNGNQKQNRAKT